MSQVKAGKIRVYDMEYAPLAVLFTQTRELQACKDGAGGGGSGGSVGGEGRGSLVSTVRDDVQRRCLLGKHGGQTREAGCVVL